MVFAIFLEMVIPIMAMVGENYIKDEFVKIQEFTLVIIFVVFQSRNSV